MRDRNTEDAQDLFNRGHTAYSDGDFHEAVECFSRAIKLRPDVSAGYRYRAYAYLELGDRVRALNDLDQAIRLKPDDPQVYADRAAELFAQKSFDQAITDCNRVLSLDPGRLAICGLRARCHTGRGDTESALRDYEQAIAGDADNAAQYLLWRAQLYLDCENFRAAEADASAALQLDPDFAEAHYMRGVIRQHAQDPASAGADFSEALRLKPNHTFARLGRAVCRFMLKDAAGVIADCDAVIEHMPGLVRAYELRGAARRQLGDLDGAFADFNEAIRLAPNSTMPFNYRASVHYARHDYTAAIRDHMEALKRDPRSAATFNQLAWVWATCPDPEVRNGERARECATRACELTEWSEAVFLDTLAAAYAECGDYEDAVKWQDKAIALAADDKAAEFRAHRDQYIQRKPLRLEGRILG